MTPGILDVIDGALRDFETSADAMRWVPEEKRKPGPAGVPVMLGLPPVAFALTVDTEEFARSLSELGAAIARMLLPVVEDTVKQFHALSMALFPYQHQRCFTCHPARKPRPLAVDGHAYQRRLAARRRRRGR